MKDFSKRSKQRQSSTVKPQPSQRPGKVQKHKRTWSMSSTSSAGGARVPLEEDLHFKLQQQQDMFTSTKPVSILYLRGAAEDDPDAYPVALLGEPWDLTKEQRENPNWQQRTSGHTSSVADTSSIVSPSPSSASLQSQGMMMAPSNTNRWNDFSDVHGSNPQHLASPPDQLTKIPKADDAGGLSGWIEALGVDANYQPPAEPRPKPVACFYVQFRDPSARDKPSYYKAVYIAQRTVKEFTSAVASKWNLQPDMIQRTLHVLPKGMEVEVDDDFVGQLSEGQDMIMEITKIIPPKPAVKREWEMAVDGEDDAPADTEDSAGQAASQQNGLEVRLFF